MFLSPIDFIEIFVNNLNLNIDGYPTIMRKKGVQSMKSTRFLQKVEKVRDFVSGFSWTVLWEVNNPLVFVYVKVDQCRVYIQNI